MKDTLAAVRNELLEKDLIGQDLLALGVRWIASLVSQETVLFGIKDGELMVLPFFDLNDPLFNRIMYYTKESIKDIRFSGLASLLYIMLNDGSSAKYSIKKGKSDMRSIVSAFGA